MNLKRYFVLFIFILSFGISNVVAKKNVISELSYCPTPDPGVVTENDPNKILLDELRESDTIFQIIFKQDHASDLRVLLDAGAAPNLCGPLGYSLLQWVSSLGLLDDVALLLDAGASVDSPRGPKGETALVASLENGHYDIANLLLNHGADPQVVYANGSSNVFFAMIARTTARRKSLDEELRMMRLILLHGGDINWKSSNEDGKTPIQFAALSGDAVLTEAFLLAGADPSITDNNGRNALFYASNSGDKDCMQLINDKLIRE